MEENYVTLSKAENEALKVFEEKKNVLKSKIDELQNMNTVLADEKSNGYQLAYQYIAEAESAIVSTRMKKVKYNNILTWDKKKGLIYYQ